MVGKRTQEWLKVRKVWLKEDQNDMGFWECVRCHQWILDGRFVEYHHVEKRSVNPKLRLERSNCQLLCHNCHIEVNPDYKKPLQKKVDRGIII